jgi:hypothetical protein
VQHAVIAGFRSRERVRFVMGSSMLEAAASNINAGWPS